MLLMDLVPINIPSLGVPHPSIGIVVAQFVHSHLSFRESPMNLLNHLKLVAFFSVTFIGCAASFALDIEQGAGSRRSNPGGFTSPEGSRCLLCVSLSCGQGSGSVKNTNCESVGSYAECKALAEGPCSHPPTTTPPQGEESLCPKAPMRPPLCSGQLPVGPGGLEWTADCDACPDVPNQQAHGAASSFAGW